MQKEMTLIETVQELVVLLKTTNLPFSQFWISHLRHDFYLKAYTAVSRSSVPPISSCLYQR